MARMPPQDDRPEPDPAEADPSVGPLDVRFGSLDQRLRAVEGGRNVRRRKGASRGYTQGNRVLATMIACLGGFSLLGWAADRWLGTSPWGLLGMLALGVGLAMVSIIRIAAEKPE